MKKLFALFLACMMLFLTACNQTPPNETTSDNSQTQETVDFKDTIIRNGYSDFMDLPSRIVFEQSGQVCYYSKADGKAYVYCFDPLCDHSGGKCLANPNDFEHIPAFELRDMFFINNRFYIANQYAQICSFAFDGSDLKIEYGDDYFSVEDHNENQFRWSPNFRVYGKYIYIPMNADENGNPRTLRFNTETKEMEDLTEKTGNSILPQFFYNGELYGRDTRLRTWVKADLELKEMEPIEEQPISTQFYGSIFFGNIYDTGYTSNTDSKVIGLEAYDMETGKSTVFSNEMLGLEANRYVVVAVDETYVYFYQYKKNEIIVQTQNGEEKVNKNNEGKLYRVKHDGTECFCIYNNTDPNFEFLSDEAIICGDKFIISAREIYVKDGVTVAYDNGMRVGTIGSDGKIDKFEPIELVY